MTAGPTDLRRRLVELTTPRRRHRPRDRNLTRDLRMRVLDQAGSRVPRILPDDEREALIRDLLDEVIEAQTTGAHPPGATHDRPADRLRHPRLRPARRADGRRPASARSCATAPTPSTSSGPGIVELTDLAFGDEAHLRIGHQPHRPRRRPPRRRVVADGRRPHARRLAHERHPAAPGPRRARCSRSGASPTCGSRPTPWSSMGTYTRRPRRGARGLRPGKLNIVVLGRHLDRQDHRPQRALPVHRAAGARHHHRGQRRAAPLASPTSSRSRPARRTPRARAR